MSIVLLDSSFQSTSDGFFPQRISQDPSRAEGGRKRGRGGTGTWGSSIVSEKVLFCMHLEPLIEGNDRGDRREVVCQVKGHGG